MCPNLRNSQTEEQEKVLTFENHSSNASLFDCFQYNRRQPRAIRWRAHAAEAKIERFDRRVCFAVVSADKSREFC